MLKTTISSVGLENFSAERLVNGGRDLDYYGRTKLRGIVATWMNSGPYYVTLSGGEGRKLPFSAELDLFNFKQEKMTISEFNAQ